MHKAKSTIDENLQRERNFRGTAWRRVFKNRCGVRNGIIIDVLSEWTIFVIVLVLDDSPYFGVVEIVWNWQLEVGERPYVSSPQYNILLL